MWIAGLIFGIAVMGIGLWLAADGADATPTKVVLGDGKPAVESARPGVAVLVVGIGIVCFAMFVWKGSGGPDRPKLAQQSPVSPAALGLDDPRRTPTPTATASPSSTLPPTATPTPDATSAPEDTPTRAPTPGCDDNDPHPASVGPWDDCQNGVHVIVAKVVRSGVGGRLRVYLRVENGSDYHVGIPEDAFLAVDNSGNQYQADEDHSDWEFESFGGYDLPPGRRLAGYVGLDDTVPSSAKTVRVDLNLSLRSSEYSDDDEFFTVHVSTRIGA
jgi:hypothetical protein